MAVMLENQLVVKLVKQKASLMVLNSEPAMAEPTELLLETQKVQMMHLKAGQSIYITVRKLLVVMLQILFMFVGR